MGRMDPVTIVFTIIGGLAIFMFSVKLLSESLSKITGPRVSVFLKKLQTTQLRGWGWELQPRS